MLPPAEAPPLTGRAISTQSWRDVAFLHWPVPPDAVRPFLPERTEADLLDGMTYVGLVAFTMTGAGVGQGPGIPWLGSFLETNVRLYSRDRQGRQGVVFLSLDAERLAFSLGARYGYRVPYTWSRMRARTTGRLKTWSTHRRWPDAGLSSRVVLDVGPRVEPTELDVFLTARWGCHSSWRGRTIWTPNEHQPWPLHEAEVVECHDRLVPASGLPVSGPPPVPARWSPGVAATFGRPVALR
jgi:uncharacterized protein